MPPKLPGMYFDPEKNRYFPIIGPIPGVKRPLPPSGESSGRNKKHHIFEARRRNRKKPLELLQFRELFGTVVLPNRFRYNFNEEYEKSQASHPLVWKYQRTDYVADSALEQMNVVVETPKGLKETYVLSAGSMNGSLRLYENGIVGNYLEAGIKSTPELVWPKGTKNEPSINTAPESIWCSPEVSTRFSSSISCIQRIGKHCPDVAHNAVNSGHALVTTLGSGCSGGSVYILNLSGSLNFRPSALPLHRRTSEITSFDGTIWTADCSGNGTHAVVGTNLGAALISLETRASSWVYHCKSDIFSQQFDHSVIG